MSIGAKPGYLEGQMMKVFVFVIAVFGFTGCATPVAPEETAVDAAEIVSEAPATELPAQRLEAGECGLFLWSRADENQFIFFSKAGSETALFQYEGTEETLALVGVSGDIFGQFLTEMSFQADAQNHAVTLEIVPGEDMAEGQKVSAGSLTVTDEDGWETILPIVGVRACLPG